MANNQNYLDDPVRLIRDELVLAVGESYGALLQPWQEDFFKAVFAVEEGRPKHRLVYSERRRGESKTEDVAAVALADLLVGPERSRSYAVAGDAAQAALILDSISGFVGRSPALHGISVQRMVVRNAATDSELHVMSSDAPTAYGIRPRKVYFDELSLQPDERLWTAMWSAIGKSPQSQMVTTSMAGWDFAGLGWRIREQAREGGRYFFQTRDGSELAPWLSQVDMDEQQATLHPADFARFWECRWTEPKGSWITAEVYQNALASGWKEQYRGDGQSRYVAFVDIGLVRDATAIAVAHAQGDVVFIDAIRDHAGLALRAGVATSGRG